MELNRVSWQRQRMCRIPDISGVYCLINKINGREYIGSSGGLRDRIRGHIIGLRNNSHKTKSLQDDFIQFGLHAFEVKILEVHKNRHQAHRIEKQYIKSRQPYYNINCK